MEVSVEVLGSTGRALQVTLPPQQFAEKVEQLLRKLSRTAKLKGFRPGKVPMQVVRQQYLSQAYNEVAEDLIAASLREALDGEGLDPVVQPQITVEDFGEDRPMKYQARFDVYPELTEAQIAELELTAPEVKPEESEIADGLEHLRRTLIEWQPVDAPVGEKGQVEFRYALWADGEPAPELEEGSPELSLTLEFGEAPKELCAQFAGLRAGEEKEIQGLLPERPGQPLPEGPARRYRVRILRVRAAKRLWEDPEWLAKFGGADAKPDGLRKVVETHLEVRQSDLWRQHMRAQITRALIDGQPALPVPESLRQWCLSVRQKSLNLPADQDLPEDHPVAQQAREDARQATVFQVLRRLSQAEPEDADWQKVLRSYSGQFADAQSAQREAQQRPEVREHLQREATWDALIRWALGRARVSRKPMSLKDLQARAEP